MSQNSLELKGLDEAIRRMQRYQERQDDALCSQASRAAATLNLKSWPNGVQDTFGEYVRMVAVRAREARVRAALSITCPRINIRKILMIYSVGFML